MHHVRPYKIFTALEGSPWERTLHTAIPNRRSGGSLTLLETFVLVCASRIVEARRIFEIGTFLGGTTLTLANNLPEDGELFTLDLDAQHAAGLEQHSADAPLTEIHLASAVSLDYIGSPVEHKVTALKGDSTRFDFSPWSESMDLIFIDGGHDLDTVKADTENAMKLARKDKVSCVLWHDYRNHDYSGLTYYLDELSKDKSLIHVQDTMLCLWFNDPGGVLTGKIVS